MSRSMQLNYGGVGNKVLAQTQISGTTAVSLYTPPSGKKAVLTQLFIAIYDNDVIISVYHDDDGTTYNDTTALIREVKVEKEKNILSLPLQFIPLANGGNFAVQIDKASDVTFTLYGIEVDV